MKNLKTKLKAIKDIIFGEEFFLAVAKQHNPYGYKKDGPIIYSYQTNTERELFLTFVKSFLNNLK